MWFRVDDGLAFHHKAIKAGNAALGLWVRAGAWSSQHLTDGFVPAAVALQIGTEPQVRKLLDAGLWLPEEGGYQFHDWLQCNRAGAQVRAERKQRAASQQARRAQKSEKHPSSEAHEAGHAPNAGGTGDSGRKLDSFESQSYPTFPIRPRSAPPEAGYDSASGYGPGIGSNSSSDNVNPRGGSNSDRSLTGGVPEDYRWQSRQPADASMEGVRLLNEHIAASSPRPPSPILQKTSEAIERLLSDATDPAAISAALALLRQRPGASPSLLPNLVYDVQRQGNGHFTRSYQRPRRQEDYDMKTPWEGRLD